MFRYLQRTLRRRRPREQEIILLDIDSAGDFDYLELATRCRTQNEFNRLHIGLENIATPLELAGIDQLAKTSAISERTRLWLERLRKWKPDLFDAPQHYERRSLSPHATLYQNPERDARDKGLLVAFSGNARRLMMPVSVFLQYADSRLWDVLVLKKCTRNSYLLGLEGISPDFRGLVDYLEALRSSASYRRVITLGTSSGGFAAIWAAVLMGADRGISVCGCAPRPLPSLTLEDQRTLRTADLCFVHGVGSASDHKSALALQGLFGGRLRPVADVDGHSVLGQLMKRGRFAEFLDELLA